MGLDILLLGELEVRRDERLLLLPPSRKARALLAYLVVTRRPQLRSRLVDLLWEGPDDPRGALRWSLSRIRSLLDEPGTARIAANRERVSFEPRGASVDVDIVEAMASRAADAPLAQLRAAAALFRGELCEGLDVEGSFAFESWCTAQREKARALRATILSVLVSRLVDAPVDALGYARTWIEADPLSDAGHTAVLRLLGRIGRRREALIHYDAYRRFLETSLGRRPSAEVERARIALGPSTHPPVPTDAELRQERGRDVESVRLVLAAVADAPPLVGRVAQLEAARRSLTAASAPTLLVVGEPGIGKTRFLAELAAFAVCAGNRVIAARAFEVERLRPYGPWLDLLESAGRPTPSSAMSSALAVLRPDRYDESERGDQAGLFEKVLVALIALARERPLLVVLDDIQWLDAGSAALLHFVARAQTEVPLRLVCAAREGELADWPDALRAIRGLERTGALTRLGLKALTAPEIAALAQSVDPSVEPARVVAVCGGNPLFAIEMVRALSRGVDILEGSLASLVAERLSMLGSVARSLLPWIAVLGRATDVNRLARLGGVAVPELLGALEYLEARGVIRSSQKGYEFVHDLVRDVAYRRLSEPARKLLHGQVARDLAAAGALEGGGAAELARHAALAGEAVLAARACAAAGERALRVFAARDAIALADRGLALVRTLPAPERIPLRVALLRVKVLAAPAAWPRRSPDIAAQVDEAAGEAREAGYAAEEASAFALLSILSENKGDLVRARQDTLRAAEAGRGADRVTAIRQLANTGRCLAHIEQEMPRARHLIEEAAALAAQNGLDLAEVRWGVGLLRRWDGDLAGAIEEISRAAALVHADGDRWRECACLTWLAVIEIERGCPTAALARCRALAPVARRMEGGSEAASCGALEALARFALGEHGAAAALESALGSLRELDAGAQLAWALDVAAAVDLAEGRYASALARAGEALRAATRVGRESEAAIARARLAAAATASGDRTDTAHHLEPTLLSLLGPHLSAIAQHAVAEAASAPESERPPVSH